MRIKFSICLYVRLQIRKQWRNTQIWWFHGVLFKTKNVTHILMERTDKMNDNQFELRKERVWISERSTTADTGCDSQKIPSCSPQVSLINTAMLSEIWIHRLICGYSLYWWWTWNFFTWTFWIHHWNIFVLCDSEVWSLQSKVRSYI